VTASETEPLLSTPQLAIALSKVFGEKVHPDRIRRRVKMGMKPHIDACTGHPRYRLSEVLAWWFREPKAS